MRCTGDRVPLRYGGWLRHFTASAPRHPVPVIAGVTRLNDAYT
jgi:hypothetical protein